jgi:hypothetical protein
MKTPNRTALIFLAAAARYRGYALRGEYDLAAAKRMVRQALGWAREERLGA